jgi:hypothetical protein
MKNGSTVLTFWDFAIETKTPAFEIGLSALKSLTSSIQTLTSRWQIRPLTMEHGA